MKRNTHFIISYLFLVFVIIFCAPKIYTAQMPDESLFGKIVTMQSNHSGKYVRAGIWNNSQLGAISNHVDGWEKFEFICHEGDIVAIHIPFSGKYVYVNRNNYLEGTANVCANNRTKFRLIPLRDGSFALRSLFNNKYVRAGITRNSLLGAASERIGSWETFTINSVGQSQSADDMLNQFLSLQANDPINTPDSSRNKNR